MAKRSIEIELDLQNRQAQRALQDTAKSLGDVESALDDGESAGKRMARAIERAAADMVDEIDETAKAVKALERALGPDFDADPREVVADLKQIGLTAQDIEQDADDLAAALKKSGDVKVHAAKAGFDDLGQAVGSVREETGKTRDTMTGFIGGTVGELPGISEAMGPVGEGLGQLAEGALEGELNFKQLALAGGAMAGVAVVLGQVQKRMARIAEAKAWRKEQVDSYADSLRDAEDAAAAVAEKLRDNEELILNIGEGLFEIDAVPILAAAGVSVEQFSELVAGGTEKIDEYAAAMEASGVQSDAWRGVVAAAKQEAGFFAEAQESARAASQVFGEQTEEAAEEGVSALEKAMTEAAEETANLTEEMYNAVGGAFDLESATLDLADEVASYRRQVADTDAVLADSESTDAEKEQALRDLRNAQIDVAGSALDVATAFAEEQGATAGTTEFAGYQIAKLRELQAQYPANRAEIQTYIDKLGQVPAQVDTSVNADTGSANYRLDALRRKLDDLRTRANNAIPSWLPGGRFAAGTSSAPAGMALVGEQGPELVNLPAGAQVKNAGATARMLGQGGNRTTNVYVTQNFPAGIDERAVARATRRYEQVQGPF